MQEHETIINKAVEDPLAIDSGIKSLGNVNLDELYQDQNVNMEAEESPFDTDSEIKFIGKVDQEMNVDADNTFIGSSSFDQDLEDADSDLESMPNDEILSISGNEDEDDDSEELCTADEIAANNVINKLINIAKIGEAHTPVSAASSLPNIPRVKIPNFQTLGVMRRFKDIQITKAPDAIAQQLPDLLTATIKNTLPQALTNAVRDTLPRFKKHIKKTIKKKMSEVILKPLYKEFNALNKLESRRFVILQKNLSKSIRKTISKSVEWTSANLHELVELVCQLVRIVYLVAPPVNAAMKVPASAKGKLQSPNASISQMSYDLVVHSSNKELPSKKLKVVVDIPIPALTPLNIFRPIIIDIIPYEQYTANLAVGEGPMTLEEAKLHMQEVKRLADLKSKKEKSAKKLRRLTPYQIRAQEEEFATTEAKHVKMTDEYNHYINFIDDPRPITKFSYRISNEWIELHAIASKRQSASNDHLLTNLKAKFKEEEEKGKGDLRIVCQGNLNMISSSTMPTLIMIQNLINVDFEYAQQVYDELIYEIDSRPDFVQPREIVAKNLDGVM
ncbi:hypothetical protein Tco_0362749 [Tanacetum coccineum]